MLFSKIVPFTLSIRSRTRYLALAAFAVLPILASLPAHATESIPPPFLDGARWQPTPDLRWQLQYSSTPVDRAVDAHVYKIDLFDNRAADVAALKRRGKRVVCYLNAGAWEDWRPDAKHFPSDVLGARYEGWPGERWLDIRRIEALAPVMLARLDLCRAKGFDGALLDNVDAYTNKSGFPLTALHQVRFNAWMANEARKRGLAVGMNNNPEQVTELLPYFDWALAESCFSYGWCSALKPFTEAGKAVIVVEYMSDKSAFTAACHEARALGFAVVRKKRELDAFRQECGRRS